MADTKLQELIETLKKQGVESGEETSKKIVEEAQKKADDIIAQAQNKADGIVSSAEAEATKKLEQLQSSMEIAASQFVTNLKRVIEEKLLALPLKASLDSVLGDTDFIKELLETLVQEYARQPGQKDLVVLLSEEKQEDLANFATYLIKDQGEVQNDKLLLTLQSENIDFGFMVGMTDGNVRLDFTSEAFQTLFLQFLTPRFRAFFKDIKLGEVSGK